MVVWLLTLISGVRSLYDAFRSYRKASLYSLRITGQTIYLEKALNDRFDYVDRGIWIETASVLDGSFLYNLIEEAPEVYMYNRYNPAHSYVAGEFAVYADRRWQAAVAGPVQPPGVNPAEWNDAGPRLYIRNKMEAHVAQDFIIWIPADLTYNDAQLRALVAVYKLAGKRYVIMTY